MSQSEVNEQVDRREVHGTVNLVVATAGLFDDRGLFDASGGVFPNAGGSGQEGAILKADTWTVNVEGDLDGVPVRIGDMVRSRIDSPGQTPANWLVLRGGIQSIVAGDNVNVDDTDPANPIISADVPAGGIESIVAGDNVSVDNTDPANPIISADIPPGSGVASVVGGSGISVDNTDPVNPIVSNNGVVDLTAGEGITVDSTDPANPIIAAIPTDVLNTILAGLNFGNGAAIEDGIGLIDALGRLQRQVSALGGDFSPENFGNAVTNSTAFQALQAAVPAGKHRVISRVLAVDAGGSINFNQDISFNWSDGGPAWLATHLTFVGNVRNVAIFEPAPGTTTNAGIVGDTFGVTFAGSNGVEQYITFYLIYTDFIV